MLHFRNLVSVSIPEKRETPFEDGEERIHPKEWWRFQSLRKGKHPLKGVNSLSWPRQHQLFQSLRKGKHPLKLSLAQQLLVDSAGFNPWEKGNTLWSKGRKIKWYEHNFCFNPWEKGNTLWRKLIFLTMQKMLLSFNPWEKGNTLWRMLPLFIKWKRLWVSIPEKRETPFEVWISPV